MLDSEARVLVARLVAGYPGREFPQSSEMLYVEQLRDLEFVDALAAVDGLIRTSRFLPSIAEVRLAADTGPIPEEVWPEAVRIACAMWDGAQHVAAPEWADPRILRAVRAMGVDAIRMSDPKDHRPRQEFARIYAAVRERQTQDEAREALTLRDVSIEMRELAEGVGLLPEGVR